nr:hypothetical protein CFP56_20018 [Quercus suber]
MEGETREYSTWVLLKCHNTRTNLFACFRSKTCNHLGLTSTRIGLSFKDPRAQPIIKQFEQHLISSHTYLPLCLQLHSSMSPLCSDFLWRPPPISVKP